MNDLQMTREGDLYVNNDIAVTDSIEQGIYIRLRWFFKEWKFGPDYGVKYFENIFVKNPNKQLIINDISKQCDCFDKFSNKRGCDKIYGHNREQREI